MTSGYMKCPECGEEFQYAAWVNDEWIELPEPWECKSCGVSIAVDKEKGYGLKTV